MLSRLRLSHQQLWRVLLFLPPFLILNGWALDFLIATVVNSHGVTTSDMLNDYRWWARYDVGAKWAMFGFIAVLLVSNHGRLQPLGRIKQWLPWLVVLVLLSLEVAFRFDLDNIHWRGTLVGTVLRPYLVSPPEPVFINTTAGSFPLSWSLGENTQAQTLSWIFRPLIAFVTLALIASMWRALVGRFWPQRDAGLRAVREGF